MNIEYDPKAEYEIEIWEEDFREVATRILMARFYQPVGE